MEKGLKGSFLGFTYNNIHSSTLGITRVIEGGRISENLIPVIKDITNSIEGIDGIKYFGTRYTKREIPVNFAFEGITKKLLDDISKWLDGKEIHNLILDEHPYKVYSAKVTSLVILKSVIFGNDNGIIYNGHGSVTFTCYFPFARSRYLWQDDYNIENILEWREEDGNEDEFGFVRGNIYYNFSINDESNINGEIMETYIQDALNYAFNWVKPKSLLIPRLIELNNSYNGKTIIPDYFTSLAYNYDDWIESSKIPSKEDYGILNGGKISDNEYKYTVNLFNAGDVVMPTRWWFYLESLDVHKQYNISIKCGDKILKLTDLLYSLANGYMNTGPDAWIVVDMPNFLVCGYDSLKRFTGRLYNYFFEGDFFGVPLGEQEIEIETNFAIKEKEDQEFIDFYYLYL